MNDSHRPHPNIANINLDVILFTEGFINKSPVRFLLDSGAAVSVIKQKSLPKQSHSDITETKTSAVTANGSRLNVVGQITLAVSMEQFNKEPKVSLGSFSVGLNYQMNYPTWTY